MRIQLIVDIETESLEDEYLEDEYLEDEEGDEEEEDEGGFSREEIVQSVSEAVWEALKNGMNRGFNHPLSDKIGICITSIEEKE